MTNPGGCQWEGCTAEAAQLRSHADRMTVIALADQLHGASGIARRGAAEITEARRLLLRTVESAEAAGFTVREHFSLSDGRSLDFGAAAVRRAHAATLAADLRARIGALMAAENRVAGDLTAVTSGLLTTPFPETERTEVSQHRIVQAVDYRQAPAGCREPSDPVANAEDVRKVLAPLENGVNRPNKQLDSAADIRRLYDWLVRGAVDDDTKAGFPRRVLPDGTVIGIRNSNENGSTLQVDYPNGKVQKVHLPQGLIAEAPQLPPASHAPGIVVPPRADHPLLPPPLQKADPAGLPPWLLDPSPPGFALSPVQSPPMVPWDVPDTFPPQPAPSAAGSPWSWLPEFGHDAAEAGKTVGTLAVVAGGLAVAALADLADPRAMP